MMPIISVKYNENNRWKRNAEKNPAEKNKGYKSYNEKVRAKWFCCAFKLSFVQLICKASLIFKSNLELALSIILRERELYESKQRGKISYHQEVGLYIKITFNFEWIKN